MWHFTLFNVCHLLTEMSSFFCDLSLHAVPLLAYFTFSVKLTSLIWLYKLSISWPWINYILSSSTTFPHEFYTEDTENGLFFPGHRTQHTIFSYFDRCYLHGLISTSKCLISSVKTLLILEDAVYMSFL